MMSSDIDDLNGDICRVCRSEGTNDRPLFHPCICTGSIKWIHQECLMQWMRYSHKEYCELCRYKFSFTPIYSPNMPTRLPLTVFVGGILSSVLTGFRYWLHYSVVALAWLGIVPLIASRTFRGFFSGSIDSMMNIPVMLLSTDDIPADIFQGSFIVTCTLFAFIGLVWLREQILNGGGPDWLDAEEEVAPANDQPAQQVAEQQPAAMGGNMPQNDGVGDPQVGAEVPQPQPPDDHNWNPVEWDRAAEELTLERLLGLDGSLVFLEHVFWVVSLNTLFLLVFAFIPWVIGCYALVFAEMGEQLKVTRFEGLLTTFCGYVVLSFGLLVVHMISTFTRFKKIRRAIGLCYLILKVSLLLVFEIGVLPLVCGWWLDICSLAMFDVTLKDREESFQTAPGTSMFIHWLVGMVFVYYFASFILLLREILRPGVLYFLRNLNDPDFSPIQEMIRLPMLKHTRRLMMSALIFGVTIMLVILIPANILRSLWPSFLPFVVSKYTESINELSLELLLLQVVMPTLLEQSYFRMWLKGFLKYWCYVVSWFLDLRSYLLGNEEQQQQGNRRAGGGNHNAGPRGLGAAHQALLHRGGPTGFQPYIRPRYFGIRVCLLLLAMAVSVVWVSLVTMTVPVYIGRQLMSYWPAGPPGKSAPIKMHELYTASAGMYFIWVCGRCVSLIVKWVPKGKVAFAKRLLKTGLYFVKMVVACFWLTGVIPLLYGVLLELVVVVPLRVPLYQTPILWTWQDWALGVLYTKITGALILMGPEWRMRRAIERVLRNGFRRLNLTHLMVEVVVPVVTIFSITLSIPYALSDGIVPLLVHDFEMRILISRRIYPFLLLSISFTVISTFQMKQLMKLYEHIKNDRYLVGRRLVNYNHRSSG